LFVEQQTVAVSLVVKSPFTATLVSLYFVIVYIAVSEASLRYGAKKNSQLEFVDNTGRTCQTLHICTIRVTGAWFQTSSNVLHLG
jgi:hypothetical protein